MQTKESVYRLTFHDPTVEERVACVNVAYRQIEQCNAHLLRMYAPQDAITDYVTKLHWVAILDQQQCQKSNGTIMQSNDGQYFVASVAQRWFWMTHPAIKDKLTHPTRVMYIARMFHQAFADELYELFMPTVSACRQDAIMRVYDNQVGNRAWGDLPSLTKQASRVKPSVG